MDIEKSIGILKVFRNYNKFYKEENKNLTITITLGAKESIDKAIERLLTAYEKEKEKNKKAIEFIDDKNNYFEDGENWQNILKIKEILENKTMLSDEEKKAIEKFKNFIYTYQEVIEDEYSDYEEKESAKEYQEVSEKILNLIEKQSKEIEESEQKERKAYIKGTNDADELCNKKWKDKIKAKIEELDIQLQKLKDGLTGRKTNFVNKNMLFAQKEVLQSLLEKE